MPEISIITPVYQAEKFLKKCVDSILSQSFTDWELLLVDIKFAAFQGES